MGVLVRYKCVVRSICGALSLLVAQSASAQVLVPESAVLEAAEQIRRDATPTGSTQAPRIGTGSGGALKYFGAVSGAPLPIRGVVASSSPEQKLAAFQETRALAFGIRSLRTDFVLERSTTGRETASIRANQTYAGLSVFGGQIVLEFDAQAALFAALAHVMTATDELDVESLPLTPTVDVETAKHAALSLVIDTWQQEAVETDTGATFTLEQRRQLEARLEAKGGLSLLVYDPSLLNKDGRPCLAWLADVYDRIVGTEIERVLVNANTGEILLHYPLYFEAKHRHIYDANNTPTYGPPDYGTLVRDEGSAASGIAEANAAYDYVGMTYDFFLNELGRDGLDDNGMTTNVSVRWCLQSILCQEFGMCSGVCPWKNAAFFPNSTTGLMMGEGFTCCDIIGHEYTHGITLNTCSLIYAGESGAISESLSDTFGEFIDIRNGSDCPWRLGEDTGIRLDPNNYPNVYGIRDMADPAQPPFLQPDRMSSSYWGSEVHKNCGVGNKLAYLLTVGGSFNGYTIAPLHANLSSSISIAASLYYWCQTELLAAGADYEYLYYALTQAAIDLGLSESQRETVEKACRAVEIRPKRMFTVATGTSGSMEPLVQFSTTGDLILYAGNLCTQQSQGVLTPTTDPEFVLRNGATYLARIDRNGGGMYVAGKLYQNAANFVTPSRALKVTDGSTLKAFITGAAYADSNLEPSSPYTVPAGSVILTGEMTSFAAALPPAVSWFAINNDNPFTACYTVTVTNGCIRNPTHQMLSENADFSGATWETYSSSRVYTLSSGTGTRSLWYKVKNANGVSAGAVDVIVIDVPQIVTFTINNGSAFTYSRSVALNNTCAYDPSEYIASEDYDFIGATWKTYSEAPSVPPALELDFSEGKNV